MNVPTAIIGAGNLGASIATGLLDSGKIQPGQLSATRRNIAKIDFLAERGVHVTSDNRNATENSRLILLAVKPYNIEGILNEISPVLTSEHLLISLATGVTLAELKMWSEGKCPIFRAMPNTATAVKEAMTCIATEDCDSENTALVTGLFSAIGETVVIRENLMEAATVLGACGIAYVLRFIRAMIQGGIEIGFDVDTATLIATQTVRGSTALLIENNAHPEAEIDKVTTPKGCTIAGLNEMEHQGFSSALIKGIMTSYKKIEKN